MSDHLDEHYESIPWDALVTDDARRRRRFLYLVAGVIVAVAVGTAIGRNIPSTPVAMATSDPTGTTAGTTAGATAGTTAGTTAGPTIGAVVEGPAGGEMAAAAHAAWFLADFFTVDGSDLTRHAVLGALPPGVDLPEPDATARSFVESVFPTSVEHVEADRYRVVAIVRALAAADGESYRRQPARAVAVTIQIGPDGSSLVDLPRPVPIPVVSPAELALEPGEAPIAVLDAARAEAELWGTPVEPPASSKAGGSWRVVYVVEDAEGLRWPLASWFHEDGSSASAGP